ncbi:MAG: hypothetical protein PHE09_16400 [Oscillospiraceae bacterium]|nr:hypothetical protein [Oscillospiraceae bacterium]
MTKSYQICCPKCNNHQNFYRYGKDKNGNQKYLCRVCGHQFAPDVYAAGKSGRTRIHSYPTCPVCGKAMFLHHDHKGYSNYQCCNKKCGHSIFVPKPAAVTAPSMSKLSGKANFKRMRYPVHVILTALSMFYLGKNSFRNIALILQTVMNIRVQSFRDDITNNLISVFLFFHNFVHPHYALDSLTPAQVTGLNLSTGSKRKLFLVA